MKPIPPRLVAAVLLALAFTVSVLIKLMAERVGFEPTEPFGSPVFKTGAIDHSTTSPMILAAPALNATERLLQEKLLHIHRFYEILTRIRSGRARLIF